MNRRGLLTGATAGLAALSHTVAAQPASPGRTGGQTDNALGLMAAGLDGTYIRFADDLANVLDGIEGLRILPIIGRGSLQNLSDLLRLQRVDIAFVQSDVLAAAQAQQIFTGLQQQVLYIAKLYDEEIHLFVRPGITQLSDLAGKRVNMEARSSGTALTAGFLFGQLGLQVQGSYLPSSDATELLRRGEIDAMVRIAGKPARFSAPLPEGTRLLPIPLSDALLDVYLPASFTAEDYPTLIPAGQTVETVAVGAVLACYNHQAPERRERLLRFSRALTLKFDSFLQPPRHPKWRDVNLAATLPGWTRLGAAAPPSAAPPGRRSYQGSRGRSSPSTGNTPAP